MKAEKDFIFTSNWLEKMGVCNEWIEIFNDCFPIGIAKDSDIYELWSYVFFEDIDSDEFIYWLLNNAPYTGKPLIVCDDVLLDRKFHLGDIIVKGDVEIQSTVLIKGKLTVNGKLNCCSGHHIEANQIIADEINLKNRAIITAKKDIKVNKHIYLSNDTCIFGNVNTNRLLLDNNSYLIGNVDAIDVINNGGLIKGDITTKTFLNGNNGKINGNITCKD